jgi:hypothetical protein
MDLSPAMIALLTDEWANYEAMCRESVGKNRSDEFPPDPTLGSLADSVEQMPDDILEEIAGVGPDLVRAELAALVDVNGRDEPMPELP